MGLRPTAARWFEVLTPCDELAGTVEALAASGQVQIEAERSIERPPDEPAAELEEYRRLARRFARYWPRPDFRARMTAGAPRDIVAHALAAIEAWAELAEPLIERAERLEAERGELALLAELGDASPEALAQLAALDAAGPQLEARLVALERGRRVPALPRVIARTTLAAEHAFVALVGRRDELEAAERVLVQSEARRVTIPDDVTPEVIGTRLSDVGAALAAVFAELAELSRAQQLATVLAAVQRLDWFLRNVPPFDRTRHFALVTGWTSDLDATSIRRALDDAGVHALLRLPSARLEPPIILRNPRWARPFEQLSRLLGTPSRVEADPSVLLVFLAPLLFGFMFADVGQGAVLLATGLLLKKRVPALGMLVPGGAAAMIGGATFGSVFAREDVIPPLWVHPLSEPLLVLGASVALGALVLVLGLALAGVEAYWRGAFGEWLETDATLLLVYLGLVGALAHRAGLVVAAAAALVHVFAAALRERRVAAAFAAFGKLLERTLQIGVNTVSFARVGAFALAHAGLSLAVVELARAAGSGVGAWLVLALGNALALVLEGLVVGIQTTRLVLFEFFVRFVRGEGRAFVPLLPPASDEAMTGALK